MNNLFNEHRDRLTDAEDRRIWSAMHEETVKPRRRRSWLPAAIATGAVAVIAVAVVGPDVMRRGASDRLADVALDVTPVEEAVRTEAEGVDDTRQLGADRPADELTAPAETRDRAARPETKAVTGAVSGTETAAESRTVASEPAPSPPAVADAAVDLAARTDADAGVGTERVAPEGLLEQDPAPDAADTKPLRRQALADNTQESAGGAGAAPETAALAAGEARADKEKKEAAAPTGTITGRVTADDGTPLAFVNVVVLGTRLGAMTDAGGVYTIENVPVGEHTIRVLMLGYETRDLAVRVIEDAPLVADAALPPAELAMLEPLVVAGRKDLGDDVNRNLPGSAGLDTDGYVADALKRSRDEREALGGTASGVTGDRVNAPAEEAARLAQRAERDRASKLKNEGKGSTEVQTFSQFRTAAPQVQPVPAPTDNRYPISVGGTDPVNGKPYDSMFYKNYGVNPFVDPDDDRFATFAVDVDNASYSLARAYLLDGNLPEPDAIRVEEFINSIRHHYPAPGSRLTASRRPIPSQHGTFAIYLDAAPSPFGGSAQLLRVGLKGREVDPENRKPAVLTFLVDVSGSMGREDRLGLVKQALGMLLDQMRPNDRVALVVYGSNARTILNPTSVGDRTRIEQAIASLRPEGATNAEAGLLEAYRLADLAFDRDRINRVILCSDGVANVGNTGADDILKRIKAQARRGIELTAVGFGMGNYNDVLMEQLANQGDGNYYYVDDLKEAHRVFVENLTGTLQTIAKDVKIQVEFEPKTVEQYRILGYENRDVADKDFRNDQVDAGEVGAGHEVTALFEVKLEDRADRGDLATVRIRYEDPETGRVTEEARTIRIRDIHRSWKDPEPSFRMDAAMAEFAEILRGSYWAQDGDLGQVLGLAHSAAWEMGQPDDAYEAVQLIEKAARLQPKGEGPTGWRDDPRFDRDDQ